MKRSKIFLAITTCLLAIAGVAATMAHRTFGITKAYYITSGIFSHCYQITKDFPCTRPGTGCQTLLPTPSGGFSPYQLYLSKITSGPNAGLCKTPLQLNLN